MALGAFSSTTTKLGAAKAFTNQATGVIFKITVASGRDVNAYSFFPAEDEILLSPSHRFIVTSAPYLCEGYTTVRSSEAPLESDYTMPCPFPALPRVEGCIRPIPPGSNHDDAYSW